LFKKLNAEIVKRVPIVPCLSKQILRGNGMKNV